jgi:hypothetical protein
MANWIGGRLTKAGRDLQIKVEAGQCKLELTKIKLGDGAEDISSVDRMTDLVGPKAEFGISQVEAKDGLCTVTGIIHTSNVSAGFYVREWGLFAKDPDRGEILYMISIDPNPESIPPKTAALKQAATYAMNIVVANAANIEVRIDPAGLVNTEMLARGARLIKRGTAYQYGDVLYDPMMHTNLLLFCTQGGATQTNYKDYRGASLGQEYTDGSAKLYVLEAVERGRDLFVRNGEGDVTMSADLTEPKVGVKFAITGEDITLAPDTFYTQQFKMFPNGDFTLS